MIQARLTPHRDYLAVLFDLDGTLADTAADLGNAANHLRLVRGMAPLPLDLLRPYASHGARGLVEAALALKPGDTGFEEARDAFLTHYLQHIAEESRLFDGMPTLLQRLQDLNLAWGIVTNKLTRYTLPLMRALDPQPAPQVLVCGDTTAHAKPHPAPLLKAAETVGVDPARCVYVGDDLRDIQAGAAAGMVTVAAAYGYCGSGVPVTQWPATHQVDSVAELHALLGLTPA